MGSGFNSGAGLPTKQPYGLSGVQAREAGLAPSHRIKRAMAAQNTLRFALVPPIHMELRAWRGELDAQFLAGSDQGRMPSSIKATLKVAAGRGSGGVAGDGHQSRAHHRRFTNTRNRGVHKPRSPHQSYRVSPTEGAREPFQRRPATERPIQSHRAGLSPHENSRAHGPTGACSRWLGLTWRLPSWHSGLISVRAAESRWRWRPSVRHRTRSPSEA